MNKEAQFTLDEVKIIELYRKMVKDGRREIINGVSADLVEDEIELKEGRLNLLLNRIYEPDEHGDL